MKQFANFVMNNKWVYIVFAVAILIVRWVLENSSLPEGIVKILAVLEIVFICVFIVVLAHIISFGLLVLYNRNKSDKWWDKMESNRNKTAGGKLIDLLMKGLLVTIPALMFCIIIYFAVFQSWTMIIVASLLISSGFIIDHFRKKKTERLEKV